MWFKMGLDILNCAIARELAQAVARSDSGGRLRQFAFIYLLSLTATGGANDLQDAADLARLVDTTPKQAQIVWDILIKHGVLRKGSQGYSARPWMIERGILGDISRRRRQDSQPQGPAGQQTQQPSQTGYSTDGGKTSW